MKQNHRARLTAIEEDMREQARGSQDGYLLELANRLKKILVEAAADDAGRAPDPFIDAAERAALGL